MSVQISTGAPVSGEQSRSDLPGAATAARPRLTREGVQLGDQHVPLLAGSIHYFRLEPESWRPCLEAMRDMGCTLADVYVPWSVHEDESGELDFGARRPQLDVVKFLRTVQDVGLYALVRPGPHINAELSGFGLPERVLWDWECQARSPAGEPVVLPMPPRAFPVPSYSSRKLMREACSWLERVAALLGPLAWPHGPIVMCQVDNEGALYFRDGVYEQDYHPDSLARFRHFLEARYQSPQRLAEAYAIHAESFEISAPQRFDAKDCAGLARQLDWAEYQEASIAEAFGEFKRALGRSGLERVPTCHNLPMGEAATPLDPARVGKVVDCLGMDYYHVAAEGTADAILKRTSELVERADSCGYPALAVELGAGFPPFFPPLTEHDNGFAALSCLASGIRGYNLYMAVERDRWIGAPIDRFGRRRPFADFWTALNAAVVRTRLYELTRAADVCLVIPRSLYRLERLLHAFGPISAAAFDVMGLGAYDSCFEQGPFASALFEAEAFLRELLGELTALGIGYRVAGNDAAESALAAAKVGFVVSAVGLEPALWQALERAVAQGALLLCGPKLPETTPNGLAPLGPLDADAKRAGSLTALGRSETSARLRALSEQHALFRLPAGPGLRTSLFRDRDGAPRVLFVTNTTREPQLARLEGAFPNGAVDALDGTRFRATVRSLEVPLSPQSVRMLEL